MSVDRPDAGRQRFRVIEWRVSEIAARKCTPHGIAKIAVNAAPPGIVACSDSDNLRVTGISVVVYRLVAVARGKQDDAAFAASTVSGYVIDRKASICRQRCYLFVQRIGRFPPTTIFGTPTARDDVRAVLHRPHKGLCLSLRTESRC